MRIFFRCLLTTFLVLLSLGGPSLAAGSVGVIAPSVSTSMKAREIRMKLGWGEVPLRQAGTILVVVRSALYNPLSYSYRSLRELADDADSQLNIAGPNYHIYLYDQSRLGLTQTTHKSFPADDM